MTLALLSIALVGGAARLCMPVLFKEISTDLNLDLVAVGTVWGMDSLAGFFISIPGGLLMDRFGIRKSMVAVCILASVISASRAFSGDFTGIAATTFAYGMVAVLVLIMAPKIAAAHFRGQYLGLVNSLIFVSQYLGQMFATMVSATLLSPLLGGWRNVFLLYSVPPLILLVFWWASREKNVEPERHKKMETPAGLKDSLLHVVKIKEVWLLGLLFFSQVGTLMSVNGYLPLYLRNLGWDAAAADGALTLTVAASCIGTIPIAHLSDRFKSAKVVLLSSVGIMSVVTALLFVAGGSFAVWILMAVFGLLRGVPGVLGNSLIIETRGIDSKYVGTAIGITVSVGMIGGFILPPVGNSLASIHPALPFVFWAAACLLFPAGVFFIKEPRRAGAKAA